jgi:hypothetical protein
MGELEKASGRASRSLISMAFGVSRENEILQARIKVLEAENALIRTELDLMRLKLAHTRINGTSDWAERAVLASSRQRKVA